MTSFLDIEEVSHEANNENTEGEEYYYETPDLSGGVELDDYIIAYGADDDEEENRRSSSASLD